MPNEKEKKHGAQEEGSEQCSVWHDALWSGEQCLRSRDGPLGTCFCKSQFRTLYADLSKEHQAFILPVLQPTFRKARGSILKKLAQQVVVFIFLWKGTTSELKSHIYQSHKLEGPRILAPIRQLLKWSGCGVNVAWRGEGGDGALATEIKGSLFCKRDLVFHKKCCWEGILPGNLRPWYCTELLPYIPEFLWMYTCGVPIYLWRSSVFFTLGVRILKGS